MNITSKRFEIYGRIVHVTPVVVWNKQTDSKVFSFTLSDNTGKIRIVFFNKDVDS